MHDLVHWLDIFRHFVAFAFQPYNWVGNISAGLVVGAVTVILWPRLRHWLERWMHAQLASHFKGLHDKLDAHHEAHNADLAKLHARLDAMDKKK